MKVNVHSKSPLMSPQWYNDDINGLLKIALLLQRNLRPHVKFQVLSSTQSQRVLGLESHPATTSWVSPKYSDLGYHRNVKALRSRKAHGCIINLLDFFQVVFLPFALLLGHLFVLISTTKKV